MEDKVEVEQIIKVLDIALKLSSTRLWAMHKEYFTSWDEIKISLQYRFILPSQVNQLHKDQKSKHQLLTLELYDRSSDPHEHVVHCIKVWEVVQLPSQFLVHQFIHLLGRIPSAWYVHEDTIRQIT